MIADVCPPSLILCHRSKWTCNPKRGRGYQGLTFTLVQLPELLMLFLQVEASMCHLRGVLMLKLNRGDQAKHCFMEALALDVKCYDAFDQLISGEMMTPDEGICPS
jgi:hypothetical protein